MFNTHDNEVERVNSYNYLGVVIDEKFIFQEHSINRVTKTNKCLYFIRVMSMLVDCKIIALYITIQGSPLLNYIF